MFRKLTSLAMASGFFLLAVASLAPTAAAESPWVLTDAASGVGGSDFSMGNGGTRTGTTSFANSDSKVWVSEEATASADMSGDWTVTLAYGAAPTTGPTVAVGVFSGGTCTSTGSALAFGEPGEATVTASGLNIAPGDRVCVIVTAAALLGSFTLASGAGSVATAPAGAPDFPVPAITTILLLSSGLAMVAGVVYVRKR